MKVLICGAGVIGASIAHFLADLGIAATLVERGEVACAASGKSGGFLALDWCDGSDLGPLARASFKLHQALAATLAREHGDYGYRAVDTLLVEEASGARAPAGFWLDGDARLRGQLGDTGSTAQVQPYRFTQALTRSAVARGARVVRGTVQGLAVQGSDSATRAAGVVVDGQTMAADAVVLAMGPWTNGFGDLLPPVAGLRGNSIVLRPAAPIPAHCLFVETRDPEAGNISPEIYPRPDGEVYVCGMADDEPFPHDPLTIEPNHRACEVLAGVAGRLSSALASAEILRRQACFRPIVEDGLPLLGPVAGMHGLYVATAHNCWGILNAPASGLAMARLIATGDSGDLDIRAFRPERFARNSGRAAPRYHTGR